MLSPLDDDQQSTVRKIVLRLILATDLGERGKHMRQFGEIQEKV